MIVPANLVSKSLSFVIIAGQYTSNISTFSFIPNGQHSSLELVGTAPIGPNPNASWVARSAKLPNVLL